MWRRLASKFTRRCRVTLAVWQIHLRIWSQQFSTMLTSVSQMTTQSAASKAANWSRCSLSLEGQPDP